MDRLIADRRLYVTADRGEIVEEGHPSGSWLLYAAGRVIGKGDIELYSMFGDEHGRVVYRGCPDLGEPDAEPEAEPERELTLEEARANLEQADADLAEAEVALEKAEAALEAGDEEAGDEEAGEDVVATEEELVGDGTGEKLEDVSIASGEGVDESEEADGRGAEGDESAEASVANGETPGEGQAAGADAADHSDRNEVELEEWPGRRSPEAYLKQYPTGPKAPLAQAHVDAAAARDDGADGAT